MTAVKHEVAALRMANLVRAMTDPNITRARKEQLEIMARAAATDYLKKSEAANDQV